MKRKRFSEDERIDLFDGDDWTCQACGHEGEYDELEMDHIVPLSRGGSNDEDNLQTLCVGCNREKGDLTMEEFMSDYSEDELQDNDIPLFTGAGGALVGFAVGGVPGAIAGGILGFLLGPVFEEE